MHLLCMQISCEACQRRLGLLQLPTPASHPLLGPCHETRRFLLRCLGFPLGQLETAPQPREPVGECLRPLLQRT